MRLLLVALLALAGCTPMQWVRDGAAPAPEVVEKDAASCRQQAWREAQYRGWAYQPYWWGPSLARRGSFGRSFAPWPYPYGPYPYAWGDPAFEETRLADFCMRAKGYELLPVPKPAQKAPG